MKFCRYTSLQQTISLIFLDGIKWYVFARGAGCEMVIRQIMQIIRESGYWLHISALGFSFVRKETARSLPDGSRAKMIVVAMRQCRWKVVHPVAWEQVIITKTYRLGIWAPLLEVWCSNVSVECHRWHRAHYSLSWASHGYNKMEYKIILFYMDRIT